MEGAALFRLSPDWVNIYDVSGPDAERYLHGRTTQNIKGMAPLGALNALLLSPQGRVQGATLVIRLDSSFLLLAERAADGNEESFLRALLQFKVADQLEAKELADSTVVLTLQGPAAASLLASQGVPIPGESRSARALLNGVEVLIVRSDRIGSPGYDLLVPATAEAAVTDAVGAGAVSAIESLETARIHAGIPRFGVDIDERTIASDLPLGRYVAEQKGCYTGQEVVEMATTRGRPNRRFVRLAASQHGATAARGDEIFTPSEAGKAVGVVTSVTGEGGPRCALGYVKAHLSDSEPVIIREVEWKISSP